MKMIKKQADVSAGREVWADTMRGICAVMVILSHFPHISAGLMIYITPFMLPCFFIASGYFTKNFGGRLPAFFYHKVSKELLVKLLFSLSITTFVFSTVLNLFLHPSDIPRWLYDTMATFLLKPRAVFFSTLVMSSVYFILINKLCRDKPVPMLLAGCAAAAAGFAVARENVIRFWSWDTALICVLFYIAGYCLRQKNIIRRFACKPWHALLTGSVFIASVTLSSLFFGLENVHIIIAVNIWHFPLLALWHIAWGCAFIISLCRCLPEKAFATRVLGYIGRHSLIYFMFGGPIMAYLCYFSDLLSERVPLGILTHPAMMIPVILLLTCSLTLLPCWFSDRFCPVLNGIFHLPRHLSDRQRRTVVIMSAASLVTAAAIFAASWQGLLIPNRIYADRYAVRGVDVSSWQGAIDWQTLAAQNIDFAFIKATEGSRHTDSRFADNWQGAADAGLCVGAYHFFSYDSAGRTQAENFMAAVPVTAHSLPPVVDVEFYGDKETHPPEPEAVARELRDMLDILEAHYGRRPVIYTTEKAYVMYIRDYFEDYDIWLRNVVTDPNYEHWRFWQYTNRMKLPGYDGQEPFIDMNVFNGTKEDFEAYTRKYMSENE